MRVKIPGVRVGALRYPDMR